MDLITSYDDTSFAQYLWDTIDEVATDLDWTNPSHRAFSTAIARTLRWYGGVTTVAECTNLLKLELIGTMEIWRQVMANTVTNADAGQEEDQNTIKRSQIYGHALKMFQIAEENALPYMPAPETSPQERSGVYSKVLRNRVVW